MYKVEIACAGVLPENTGQVSIDNFDRVIPLELGGN
jgi:hypothetical protein